MTITPHVRQQLFDGDNTPVRLTAAATDANDDQHVPRRRVRDRRRPGAKKSGKPWDLDEHERFLDGLQMFPSGPWKMVAAFVRSRNTRQVMTHAQKYRQKIERRRRRAQSRSVHDGVLQEGDNIDNSGDEARSATTDEHDWPVDTDLSSIFLDDIDLWIDDVADIGSSGSNSSSSGNSTTFTELLADNAVLALDSSHSAEQPSRHRTASQDVIDALLPHWQELLVDDDDELSDDASDRSVIRSSNRIGDEQGPL